jgi:sporulation protein YlmC with PRC-barrel domain
MNGEQEQSRQHSKDLIGKKIISKEGKTFGSVKDLVFETNSGELIHIVVEDSSPYLERLDLEKNQAGNILIPFSAMIAMGDLIVIAEEDIV